MGISRKCLNSLKSAGLVLVLGGVLTAAPGTTPQAAAAALAEGTQTIDPGTELRTSQLKLTDWAKAQLAADRARKADPPEIEPLTAPTTGTKTTTTAPKSTSTATTSSTSSTSRTSVATTKTLVLYDTAGPYGFLGELYAMTTANLAGHFGQVTTRPVSAYTAGQVEQYTATIYIGSTYYGGAIPDAIPDAFYTDVATTTRPVVWMNDNIWTLAGKMGTQAFTARYGWDPASSYFSPVGKVTRVDYKTRPLTRTVPEAGDGGVLRPHIVTGPGIPAVTTLAQANDTSTEPVTEFPWAIRSANLTYLGEIPYAYVKETDRIIAWHDLLFDVLAPGTQERHRAILRLEDISPKSDPNQLMAVAQYLAAQQIPYAFQVVPVYTDPKGAYNNGTPETIRLTQRPAVVNALKYMLAHGGKMVAHGYTHQYKNVDNPYTGVTGDDFEFFRSHVDAGDNVILDGPVAEDSITWATTRLTSGKLAYTLAGLPTPRIWTTPHYAASATDYAAFRLQYEARLERSLYFSGQLTGGQVNGQRFVGQFFPYPVRDVNGTKVLPENLGNYEPEEVNNHPPRLPADIIRAANYNLAVRDGFASFFHHPYYGVAPLQETVNGIRDLGYTFIDPTTALT